MTRWALSKATNPSVLLLDTSPELTDATIETCPPSTAPHPLDRLLEMSSIRSIDLHRHRARLNLRAGASLNEISAPVRELLTTAWGSESSPLDEAPRSFPVSYRGPRRVAESLRMAGDEPILHVLFDLPGVVEVILETGQVIVRLSPLFSWSDVDATIRNSLRTADA